MIYPRAIFIFVFVSLLVACLPDGAIETVDVTRPMVSTMIVSLPTETVERPTMTPTALPAMATLTVEVQAPSKDLVICMSDEPETLYLYDDSTLSAQAIRHAIFETDFTTLSYGYQAQGLEKLPSLADGDAWFEQVRVQTGDLVVNSNNDPVLLEAGVEVINAVGETIVFDGTPVMMEQLVAEFTLKPRVWADGVPVTAVDSVYSYQLDHDPDTPRAIDRIDWTASYEAVGELTTRWVGLAGYRDETYFTNFWQPLPHHVWQEFATQELYYAKESSELPLGDGPFVIQEWVKGEYIYLTPNEHYYRADEGLPYLDSVTFLFLPRTNSILSLLMSGRCDIAPSTDLDVGQSPFLFRAEEEGYLITYYQAGLVYEHIDFGINSYGGYGDDIGRPDWFQDKRVRQAMMMCTDRQAMVDEILYGQAKLMHSYIPSSHPLYPDDLQVWPYDVARANALLDEVGFVDSDGDGIREYAGGANGELAGEPFVVTLGTTAMNEMRQQITQLFKENMRDCGIEVELYYLPSTDWFADGPNGRLFGRQFDLGEFAWLTGSDPSCNLFLSSQITGPVDEVNPNHYEANTPYGGWGAASNTGWVNQSFDEACQRALTLLPGEAGYIEGHQDAVRIFAEELPILPLFTRLQVAATRPQVLNFGLDPTQPSELYNLYELDLQVEENKGS